MSDFIGNGDLLKALRHHADVQTQQLTKMAAFAERADARDVLNNQALLNNTGKTNEALVVIGDLLSKLVDVTIGAKKTICDNQDCIHGGISRNGDLLAGIAERVEQLVAAGGQDAILENMMDDLRPLAVEAGGAAKFGRCELVGVVSMGQAEARARYTREEADAMRLRKELSNAYDQLAQVNDRCNEIAAERDDLARIVDGKTAMITRLQNKLARMGFEQSQIDEISNH